MILKPSNVQPSGQAYDASEDIELTWQNNGDVMVSFRVVIKDNATDATVHMSPLTTSSICKYTVPANTLSNGVTYKYTVTVYNSVYETAVSDWYIVKCSARPVVTVVTDGIVRNQNTLFQATYSQGQSIALKSYRLILYNSLQNTLATSTELYDGLLQYTFTGLMSGDSYYIECQATSQDDVVGTSGKVSFTVDYVSASPTKSLNVTPVADKPTVMVDWINSKQVLGVYNDGVGSPLYTSGKYDNAILLSHTSTVKFSETIPEEFTLRNWVKKSVGFTGTIVKIQSAGGGNYIDFGYDGTAFYLTVKNGEESRTVMSDVMGISSDYFFYAIRGNEAIVYTGGQDGSLIKIA